MAFSRIWMKRRPFVVMLCDHLVDASLSLCILMGLVVNRLYRLRSLRRLMIRSRHLVHTSTSYISASVELWAVIV